jgi:N-glycosylase/DNA lyase
VRLRKEGDSIVAETTGPIDDWRWLEDYLQIGVDLPCVLATFPTDNAMCAAVEACRGLRLLRQEPWECLASFICSSTKQIVQIRQIIGLLCERFGEPLKVPAGSTPAFGFPSAARLAAVSEDELRRCKMGFRARYLLQTAGMVASGKLSLGALRSLAAPEVRERLMVLPGVGRKIADCVLLFAYGFPRVFPVDIWVQRALSQLYFPSRTIPPRRLHEFADSYFGPNAGYAQQYLFHYMRVHSRRENQ